MNISKNWMIVTLWIATLVAASFWAVLLYKGHINYQNNEKHVKCGCKEAK